MSTEDTEYELQQLVSSDEEATQPNLESLTPLDADVKASTSSLKAHYLYKSTSDDSYRSSKLTSLDINTAESNVPNSKLTRNITIPSITANPSHTFHSALGSHTGAPRNIDHKPPRPPQPNITKLQNKKDVMDVRQMEQALLHLLDDFHSGKLRAFGKNCSMEQMTAIHEQQEHLARLHFELGAQQELFTPLSEEGLRHGADSMRSLMDNLEQLSISIEKLHVINSKSD